MRRLTVLFVAVAALTACSAGAPPVTPELVTAAQKTWPDATNDEITHGRLLLTTRCTACHGVRGPADYHLSDWEYYLKEMGQRAKLDEIEAKALRRYVLTAHEPLPAPAAH